MLKKIHLVALGCCLSFSAVASTLEWTPDEDFAPEKSNQLNTQQAQQIASLETDKNKLSLQVNSLRENVTRLKQQLVDVNSQLTIQTKVLKETQATLTSTQKSLQQVSQSAQQLRDDVVIKKRACEESIAMLRVTMARASKEALNAAMLSIKHKLLLPTS